VSSILLAFVAFLCSGALHELEMERVVASHDCTDSDVHISGQPQHAHDVELCVLCHLSQQLSEPPRADPGLAFSTSLVHGFQAPPLQALPDDASLFSFLSRAPPAA
jgi:hypothetical protein